MLLLLWLLYHCDQAACSKLHFIMVSIWKYTNHPSLCLSGFGSWGQEQKGPHLPLHSTSFSSSRWWKKASPGHLRDVISPAHPGSASDPYPSWTCPKHLPSKMSRRHLTKCSDNFLALLEVEKQWMSFSLNLWGRFRHPCPPWISTLLWWRGCVPEWSLGLYC